MSADTLFEVASGSAGMADPRERQAACPLLAFYIFYLRPDEQLRSPSQSVAHCPEEWCMAMGVFLPTAEHRRSKGSALLPEIPERSWWVRSGWRSNKA